MDKALALLERLAHAFGIRMRCYAEDMTGLVDFDDGLRFRLYRQVDTELLKHFLWSMETKVMYLCADFYDCCYCLFRLPEPNGDNFRYCVIGPWQEHALEDEHIDAIIRKGNVPNHLRQELVQYLNVLPQVNVPRIWEAVLEAGISHFYGEDISVVRPAAALDGGRDFSLETDAVLTMKIIKDRYDYEEALLKAVSEGNTVKAVKAYKNIRGKYNPKNLWTEDKLRNAKNYTIVMETLLREAAKNGYVHPAHLDAASADFCWCIENVAHISELSRLTEAMIRRYCALVGQFSLRGYSPLIRNVINTVDFNFREPLTVAGLAKQFYVNPSNLSTQFKREKGIPLTAYINATRIAHAALLLRSSGDYIQQIAEQCGFLDTTYFNRLFKRHYGMSPLQFRRENNRML
jgi:AraC-like DNA-binding protein